MGINRHGIFGCMTLALALGIGLSGCVNPQPLPPPDIASEQKTAPALSQTPAQSAAVPTPAQTAEQRRAQLLIAQVERAFKSGEAHYRKGQLVDAKRDFDSAVDMMLSSGLEIKGDPLLDEEFNRVLDAVNALEMEALKQGNGFAPAVEPTPADVANDVTFEVDPNLVAKAKAELVTTKSDLPLVINDYVAVYINFFANSQRGHNTLKHSLERSGKYKEMIQRVMTEEGVPQDLIYLAVAESGFQPQAVNGHSGAGGMWQFMPQAQYYGLVRNGYVDERFDPEKSTRASARYLKMLYNQFGDWYLAMAAYNWGGGMVQRAVQKTGYADFWELYRRNNLPAETKNYVPEILAAIIIAKNPSQYGFDDVRPDPAVVTDTVPIDYAVDLRLVADIVDAQPQELLALNPGLLRLTTPPAGVLTEPFGLHLPPGTGTLFVQRIGEIPTDRRTQWRYHRVTSEDTLASVARNFHVSVDQLAAVNQLHADDSLDNLEALVVPVPQVSAPTVKAAVYKTRKGDTLVTIADRFGVSIDDLHKWNSLTGTSVSAGKRIHVTEPVHLAPHVRDRSHRASTSRANSKSKSFASAESDTGRHGAGNGKDKQVSSGEEKQTNAKTAKGRKSGSAASKPEGTTKAHAMPKDAGKSSGKKGSASRQKTDSKPTTKRENAAKAHKQGSSRKG